MANFSNQASLSYRGTTVNSNIASGEIVEVLSASKTAVSDEYAQNSDISYVINLINTGGTDITDITVSDDLGAYAFGESILQPLDYVEGSLKYFVDGVLTEGLTVSAGPPLTVSGIRVPANGVTAIVYTAAANGFAPPAETGSITNTATVQGAGIRDISVSETVNAELAPVLDIIKTASPSTVSENGELRFTLIIQNRGNTATVLSDNVIVSDDLDPVLRDISVSYNGEIWTSPADYSYDEATGSFVTAAGAVSVPAASYYQDPLTGEWIAEPGTAEIVISGRV